MHLKRKKKQERETKADQELLLPWCDTEVLSASSILPFFANAYLNLANRIVSVTLVADSCLFSYCFYVESLDRLGSFSGETNIRIVFLS